MGRCERVDRARTSCGGADDPPTYAYRPVQLHACSVVAAAASIGSIDPRLSNQWPQFARAGPGQRFDCLIYVVFFGRAANELRSGSYVVFFPVGKLAPSRDLPLAPGVEAGLDTWGRLEGRAIVATKCDPAVDRATHLRRFIQIVKVGVNEMGSGAMLGCILTPQQQRGAGLLVSPSSLCAWHALEAASDSSPFPGAIGPAPRSTARPPAPNACNLVPSTEFGIEGTSPGRCRSCRQLARRPRSGCCRLLAGEVACVAAMRGSTWDVRAPCEPLSLAGQGRCRSRPAAPRSEGTDCQIRGLRRPLIGRRRGGPACLID